MTDNESRRYNDSLCRHVLLAAALWLSPHIIRNRNPKRLALSLPDTAWPKMKRDFSHGRGLLGR